MSLIDVFLIDPAVLALKKEKYGSQMSDDEPLYDSVASDDDYAAVTTDISSINSSNIDNEVTRFFNLNSNSSKNRGKMNAIFVNHFILL